MAEKRTYAIHVSRNFVRCEVWTCENNLRIGTSIITPDKGLKQSERLRIIQDWLRERFKIVFVE